MATPKNTYQKPFLKWAGSKAKILDAILGALPTGDRLIEPFVGSGVVFLNAVDKYKEIIVGDSNPDLINLYEHIKTEGPAFIKDVAKYFDGTYFNEASFYALRTQFNKSKDTRERAILFVYLNRHCFNGLCRYNSKGEFNVPVGRYKTILFPEADMLKFHQKSQNVSFNCGDFEALLSQVKPGDVVYMDPPYLPLTATANFSDYSSDGGFGLDKQEALAKQAERMKALGARVVISNHDTAVARDLYRNATQIHSIMVQRMISGNGNRDKAPELIAVY